MSSVLTVALSARILRIVAFMSCAVRLIPEWVSNRYWRGNKLDGIPTHMPKIRERHELQWLVDIGKQFELSLDKLQPVYLAFLDHIFPEIEKSTPEQREAAYQRIFDYVEGLEPNAEMTVKEAMHVGQLKEKSRSDNTWTRAQLKNNGLLQRHPTTGETFVKLIRSHKIGGDDHAVTTNKKNGEEAAD